jgi:hypothetical protein
MDCALFPSASKSKTTLMGYFERNRTDENACLLFYVEFPEYYTWKENKWKFLGVGFRIGDLCFGSPSSGECFYLLTLLTAIRGSEPLRSLLGNLMASSMLLTRRPVLPGDFLRMTSSGGCVFRKPVP